MELLLVTPGGKDKSLIQYYLTSEILTGEKMEHIHSDCLSINSNSLSWIINFTKLASNMGVTDELCPFWLD